MLGAYHGGEMRRSLLADAFAHHVWASLRLIDTCLALTQEQLGTAIPGTYGSILETTRHLVGSDAWYLHRMSGQRYPTIDEDQMDLPELRAAMERNGANWSDLLAEDLDTETLIVTHRNDGSETHTPASGSRRYSHGTDHRS